MEKTMEKTIESLLKDAGKHGLSIKQLKRKSGLSKNKVKEILFHSKCVKDTDPLLHGSLKKKIHVYSFQPFEATYIKRKLIKNHKNETVVSIKEFIDEINKEINNISCSDNDSSSDDSEEFEEFEKIDC